MRKASFGLNSMANFAIVIDNTGKQETKEDTQNNSEENMDNENSMSISVIVNNNPAGSYTPTFIDSYQTLVPLKVVAAAAGFNVDDSVANTITLTNTEVLLKIPLDADDPFIDCETHMIVLTPGSDIASLDGSEIKLSAAPSLTGNQVFVPLQFFSEIMDMDVIWSEEGIGILGGDTGALISTRLRGSIPLAGKEVFQAVSPDIISIRDNEGNAVALGMDVAEMQKNMGNPGLAWGRGVPTPQMYYEYGDKLAEGFGNSYVEIGCSLGTVTMIQLGPGSGSILKTGMGIAVGDPAESVIKAYKGVENHIKTVDAEDRILLAYNGDTLEYAMSSNNDDMSDSDIEITHVLDFMISGGKIEVVAIADLISARELQ